jgi:hypothetical protein
MIPLTFGTVSDGEHYQEEITLTLEGVGKRCGVALTSDGAVKMSPATFAAMWNRAPPIKQVKRLTSNLIEACEYAVARAEKLDAPTKRDAHAPKNTSGKTRKETLVPSKRAAGGQDIGKEGQISQRSHIEIQLTHLSK